MKTHRYGWIPDTPDHRDIRFSDYMNAKALTQTETFEHFFCGTPGIPPPVRPLLVNLKPGCPPIYDQGDLGSCTAQAIAAAVSFERHRQGLSYFEPSRLFIYYNERALEGTVLSDSGAQIRDGFKTIAQDGVCSEHRWPYLETVWRMKPFFECYDAALHKRTLKYLSVSQAASEMQICLMTGYPFVFGVSVYESFESDQAAKTGVIPMPSKTEDLLGGHALLCIGYNMRARMFLFRNSWGASWGQAGYGWIPFEYLENSNLSSDFWTIRLEEV